MKLALTPFLLLFLVLFSSNNFAQRTVNVPPGFGTISSIIDGDTTSAGERQDTNTVYILERDGEYILDGEFSPRYPVNMAAAEGSGARPRIILGVPSGGTTPDQALRPRANFSIKGCYVSAQDELGGVSTRIVRLEENGIKVIVDDCVLDLASQAAFRINTSDCKLFITNTIISNIGKMDSPENGRAFDDRGNDIDTLYVENCTFYNLTFRVLRDGGGRINYVYFNHNTIVNIGFGAIDFGETLEAYIANNIIKNGNFLGVNDATGDYIMHFLPWTGNETPNIVIKNNNIFDDPALLAVFPDSVGDPVAYDSLSNAYIDQGGSASTNISEGISFTDGPESPISQVTAYFQDASTAEGFLDTSGHADFDFAYETTAQSYTGGTGGQPIGALNWFDMTVGIKDYANAAPGSFTLYQNYPNPFNPTTQIAYNIPSNSFVTLKVYDILGKEVATLVNAEQQAGLHELNFNASNLSSGIYFYKLETSSFVKTNKMLLLK
jgi:Secretion system C-terminal sorting domain